MPDCRAHQMNVISNPFFIPAWGSCWNDSVDGGGTFKYIWSPVGKWTFQGVIVFQDGWDDNGSNFTNQWVTLIPPIGPPALVTYACSSTPRPA